MPAHSRPKDGVLSHAYVAGIHVLKSRKNKTWMAGISPAMTANSIHLRSRDGAATVSVKSG